MTRPEIIRALRANDISRDNAVAIYTGNITQYRPTGALFSNVRETIRAEGADVDEAQRRFSERRRTIADLIGAPGP